MFKVLLTSLLVAATSVSAETLVRAADLARALERFPVRYEAFDLTGRVDCVMQASDGINYLVFRDGSGNIFLRNEPWQKQKEIRPGDAIHARGRIRDCKYGYMPNAVFDSLDILTRGEPPEPNEVSLNDALSGDFNWHYVRIRGILRDAVRAETSPIFWIMLAVGSDDRLIRVHLPGDAKVLADCRKLIGREITVDGFPNTHDGSPRKFSGRIFHSPGRTAIRLGHPVATGKDIPELESIIRQEPARIAAMGRIRATGRVLCAWSGNRLLVRTRYGDVVQVVLEQGCKLPLKGDGVEIVGLPETDLFHVTLVHAVWRPADSLPSDCPPAHNVHADSIRPPSFGSNWADMRFHGQKVSLAGTILRMPDSLSARTDLLIEDHGTVFPVDVSSVAGVLDRVEVGCRIRATGICLMEAEVWRPDLVCPQIRSFSLILDDARDLEVLSRPPWWTPRKLTLTILGLLALMVAILLRTRRQRQVAAAMARVKTQLKVGERTRLAVELHDSLAQTLTGVSLEIDTASKVAESDPEAMSKHLGCAAQSLKSCRDELRNCLWDLRNRALEASTMDEAICQTLAPHTAGVDVSVRFAVPRDRISDNTAHTILRIIRELVLNAVRHGGAKHIRIAGSSEAGQMKFSVRDDGCGFDPASAPGFAEGHFGLLGIRERIDECEGEFTLESSPGKGTKAIITLSDRQLP